MALNNHDQARIREYLLGHLNDEEQESIEERLMAEDDLFEELEISKGELVEEYCGGELAPEERQWLEGHYLASTEGRQRHALALAIGCLKQPEPVPSQPSFFEKLAAFWNTQRWVAAPVVAVALVLVVAGITWRSFYQPRGIVTVSLTNTQLNRSSGADALPQKVNLSSDAGELRASLTLPKSFPQGTRFKAVLDNQTEIKQVKVVDHKENVVTISIPAQDLPPGEYALELTATKNDGTEEAIQGSYRFDVN